MESEPERKRKKTAHGVPQNGTLDEGSLSALKYSCPGENSERNIDFQQPQSREDPEEERAKDAGNERLPVCDHGIDCNETGLIHFAEFWHPTKSEVREEVIDDKERKDEENECQVEDLPFEMASTQPAFDDWCDTDSENSEEGCLQTEISTRSGESLGSQLSRDNTVLSRGPSIVKCYSLLSEDERRELIRRAFEIKEILKKELGKTLSTIEEKNKELRRVHSQLEKGHLIVEGEEEALNKDDLCFFTLFAEREYKEGSADQMHFRLAESQFYRLVDAADKYRVTKVEYVVNPLLIRQFQNARQKLKAKRGEQMSYPILAFHGTREANIHSICQVGFRVPGDSNFEHATDSGNYGRGVYFSEYPSYSMTYIRGASKLLLCQVLPGKVFRCTNLIHGEPLEFGHDSHTSPDGKELVIFNSYHILPSYVVHYGEAKGDFLYEKA